MKTKQVLFAILLTMATGAFAKPIQSQLTYKCVGADKGSFTFLNTGNPRNQSDAQIQDFEDPYHFVGRWLWFVSEARGFMSSKQVYKDADGGVLTLVQQRLGGGRGGFCGRGSCDSVADHTGVLSAIVTAQLVTKNGQEFLYTCN